MGELDTLCVPDVFATCNKIEDAGGGCLRIYNCVEKGGQLIPVGNAVVFPASCILTLAKTAQQFALGNHADGDGRQRGSLSRLRLLDERCHRNASGAMQSRGQIERRLVIPILNLGQMRLGAAYFVGQRLQRAAAVLHAPVIKGMGLFISRHATLYNLW